MRHEWLKCQVKKGMFSDELAIVFSLSNGHLSSVFVPKSKVQGEIDREGKVSVDVFEDGDTTWAVLPTEYRETVPVSRSELVAS